MLKVTDTRGLQVGPNFNTLNEMKERTASASMGSADSLAEAEERIRSRTSTQSMIASASSRATRSLILGVIPDIGTWKLDGKIRHP